MKLDLALRASSGILVGALISAHTFAGGVDVSTDTIYSDDVVLATDDGTLLDIDGDGNVDLAVASNRDGVADSSRYYLGNGDGTFGAPVLISEAASSEVAIGDINGDMFLDLVLGRRDETDLYHLGAGMVVAAGLPISADTTRTLALALGDLDMDGDLDAVTGNGHMGGTSGGPLQPNRFYLNDVIPGGSVAFTGADISADADDTRSIALADLDGDGDLDVIAGNDETTPGSNRVYLNQFVESGMSAVSFGAGMDFGDPNDQTGKLLIGDLDGDGDLDIVTLNFANAVSPGINRFFINDLVPGGTFAIGAANDISADAFSSSGGVLADFDGDGDLDVAVANLAGAGQPQPTNQLFLNEVGSVGGSVTFATGLDISADQHMSRELAAFDLNGDGNIDLIAGNQDQVDRRYLNNGTADPFTNVAPVIDDQVALTTPVDTALAIALDDLTVTDPDNVFPADFTLTVQPGANYTVAGATITPDAGFEGNLSVPVVVNDGTDNSAAFNLTVTVGDAPPDTTPPVITLNGPATVDVNLNDTYVDQGATATDDVDGDITANIATVNNVDTSTAGTYTVTYDVSDAARNAAATVTRTINVIDPAPPPPPPPPPAPPMRGDAGGGSLGILPLFALLVFVGARRYRRRP